MTAASELERSRDAALRRVGRNVVNFQKLEAKLRQVIPMLQISVTQSNVQTVREASARALRKKPMGDLADNFHARVFGGESEIHDPKSLTEVTVTHSLRIETTPTERASMKARLRNLVRERNLLIHHDLAAIDFCSTQACDELSAQLDEQNSRICKQHEQLCELARAQSLALAAIQAHLESDASLKFLSSGADDA